MFLRIVPVKNDDIIDEWLSCSVEAIATVRAL